MDDIHDQLQSIESNTNIDVFQAAGKMTETSSQYDILQHTLQNKISENVGIEVNPPLKEPISNRLPEQEKTEIKYISDDGKIKEYFGRKMSIPRVLIKKQIVRPLILNNSRKRKKIPLNLEKNAISKQDNTIDVKLSSPSITSDQTKATTSIMTVSSATVVEPAISTITMVQSKSDTAENSCSKIVSTQKPEIKLNDSTSNILVVPHNGVNYQIKNSVKPSLISNTGCNESAEQKKQLVLTNVTQGNITKKVSKFVTRMQKQSDGTYKMLTPPGQIPAGVENLFNPNSHFIKQKSDLNLIENERKVSYFVQTVNTEENNLFQKDSTVLSEETNCMKIVSGSSNNIESKSKNINNMVISSVNSITKETNHSENELQESSKETKSIKTPSIKCMLVEPKNVEEQIKAAKGTNISITEKTAHVDKELIVSSEETNSMESSQINSISENTFNILDESQMSSQKTNCIEMTSVSISKETNHIENELQLSSEKTNNMIIQTVNVEPKNIKKEIQFAVGKAVIETSPSNYIIEETNDNEEEPEVSSEETSCKETSSKDKPSDNLIPVEPKNIKKEIQFSERKAGDVKETSPSNYIIGETGDIEEEQEISSEETNCMEPSSEKTPSANFIPVEPKNIKKRTQAAEETCVKTSLGNSMTEKTTAIQNRTQGTSDQTKYLDIPSVNPNTVKSNHDQKESQMSLKNTSSNVTFKAPDIASFQKHKFIVSRTTANKKYAMKNINDTQNKIKLKAISNQELLNSPGLVNLLPNTSRPIFPNRPLIISKYDPKIKLNPNFNKNGKKVFVKIVKKPSDVNNSRSVISIDEMKKMFPGVINSSKVIRVEKNKIPPSIEIQQEKKRIRLSDEAYKMINSKQVAPINKSDVPFEENQQLKKPIIDRKKLLQTLKSRINKKKQLLEPTVDPEKKTLNDNINNLNKLETPYSKPPENKTHLILLHQKITKNLEGKGRTILNLHKQKQMQFKMKELQNITSNYLTLKHFTSAPKKLFDKPFPTEKNLFKIGHKLEGIDPEHEALFCAMTIVETCGYRLKLHFDGYPAKYDFWVNVDCPDIFYTNWCKQNNHTLQPPKGYEKEFDWDVYLHENGDCIPAPRINFICTKNICSVNSHSFKTGLKCEALDKMTRTITKQLICVATIADVLGDRIRIHFDGWNDDFDYWTDITSTNIHPIGWCDNNGRSLCPPNGYNDLKGKKPFKWCEYLKETNSEAVPESAFIRRPLREFTLNMAIEVVDLVVPSLIRVALIVDVRGDELKILYDGFDSKYAYWIEDDSPDIHPIGWCLKTNHPLEIPHPDKLLACKVVGCNGKGNTDVLKPNHFLIQDCPYEFERWEKIVARVQMMPDRLKSDDLDVVEIKRKKPRRKKLNDFNEKQEASQLDVILNNYAHEQKKTIIQNKSNKMEIKKKKKWRRTKVKKNKMSIESIENFVKEADAIEHNAGKPVERNLYRSTLGIKGRIYTNYPSLNMPKIPNGDARKWSIKEVGTFVDEVVKLNSNYRSPDDEVNYSSRFIKKAIKGEMFLNLHQSYLTKSMKIPLGSALKIFNGIIKLRREIPALTFKNENWIINQY